MFLGSYTCKLDQKNRFRIPTAFREELLKDSSPICLYKGIDGCYILTTQKHFAKVTELLDSINSITGDRKLQAAKRLVYSFYKEIEEDSQGRYVLPKSIRDDPNFNFDGEILFAGMKDCVEIWSKKRYESLYEDISYDEALAALQNSGC